MSILERYIHTDSICYFQDYPDHLVELQEVYWTPIIKRIESEYGLKLNATHGILSIKQNEDVVSKMIEEMEKMSSLQFSAFEKAVLLSKSFFVGLALIKGWIDVQHAANAARVEYLAQIKRWGEVEDAHDVDREEMRRQLGASAVCALAI